MHHSWKRRLPLLATALGIAVLGCAFFGPAATTDDSLVGNWKANVISQGKQFVFVLVKLEQSDGKPAIHVVAPKAKNGAMVEDVEAKEGALRFTLRMGGTPYRFSAYVPQGETKPKKLIGNVQPPGNAEQLILERTTDSDIAEKDKEKDSPGFDELERVLGESDAAKREAGLKALAKKHTGEPVALTIAELLTRQAVVRKQSTEKISSLAEDYFKIAAVYGREMQQHALLQIARGLLYSDKNLDLALKLAQRADKQMTPNDLLTQRAAILDVLSHALSKSGKDEQAKTTHERLAKLQAQLDEEFEKHAIPFELPAPSPRKGNSDRVVLLELFTGALCPPCVAADVAFDAVLKTNKSSDVVLLQYHLHIPGPDPLTNADSEKRQQYYRIEGTPSMFLDGKQTDPLGGPRSFGKASYETLHKQLDGELAKNAAAKLKLDVKRDGDKIDIAAEVADSSKTGDRVRLRFALVEEVVHYPARNGQRLHQHVVRSFLGGADGFAVLDASIKKKVSVNLTELKSKLGAYLDDAAKTQPFPDDNRPLALKHLKVVAFVQDDATKQVLQAAQADVSEAK